MIFKKLIPPILLFILWLYFHSTAVSVPFENRWFFYATNLANDSALDKLQEIIKTANQCDINGIVLGAKLDYLDQLSPAYSLRVKKVKSICDTYHIEIIPLVFTVGYGGTGINHNKNLAEGFPVKNFPMVVINHQAIPWSVPSVHLINPDLENHLGNQLYGFDQSHPGVETFVDTSVYLTGRASLRFENLKAYEKYDNYVSQVIQPRPYRFYKISCWIKTEDYDPNANFSIWLTTESGKYLAQVIEHPAPNSNWHKVTMGFNSMSSYKVRLYIGSREQHSGKLWVDNLSINDVSFTNILRRPGTPLVVKNANTDKIYQEGVDYSPVIDTGLNYRFDHESPIMKIPEGSHITENQLLSVDYYHALAIGEGQVSECMSEPQLYEFFKKSIQSIHNILMPDKYFLDMDEIREAGSCLACTQRNIPTAKILSDCITKQYNIIKGINPRAQVFIWSDMLDPYANAHPDYYLVKGDLTGVWNDIPKDITIVCWNETKKYECLQHFSKVGFNVMAAAYFDDTTMKNTREWIHYLALLSNAEGLMYTTWKEDYSHLLDFTGLISKITK